MMTLRRLRAEVTIFLSPVRIGRQEDHISHSISAAPRTPRSPKRCTVSYQRFPLDIGISVVLLHRYTDFLQQSPLVIDASAVPYFQKLLLIIDASAVPYFQKLLLIIVTSAVPYFQKLRLIIVTSAVPNP